MINAPVMKELMLTSIGGLKKMFFFQNLTVFNEIWRTAKENFPTSARDT